MFIRNLRRVKYSKFSIPFYTFPQQAKEEEDCNPVILITGKSLVLRWSFVSILIDSMAGNKCDLEDKRQISCKEAAEYAQSIGAFFMETSAKTGFNIDKAFLGISSILFFMIKSLSEYNRGCKSTCGCWGADFPTSSDCKTAVSYLLKYKNVRKSDNKFQKHEITVPWIAS